MSEIDTSLREDQPGTVKLIYILYLASILVGITGIVGVILAYMNKGSAPEWLQSHYVFQIHTFWKGLLYMLLGAILTVVLIGFLVMLFALVWWIVRCLKGLKAAGNGQPIEDPRGWLF